MRTLEEKTSRIKRIIRGAQTLVLSLDFSFRTQYKPNMDLNGKVVVITGASMGIGEAIGLEFVRHGASVVFSSRDAGRAEAARRRVGSTERTVAMACDVSKRSEIERMLQETLSRFKRVD